MATGYRHNPPGAGRKRVTTGRFVSGVLAAPLPANDCRLAATTGRNYRVAITARASGEPARRAPQRRARQRHFRPQPESPVAFLQAPPSQTIDERSRC